MRVLILRPEPGNAATAAAVVAMGFVAVSVPLFETVAVPWNAPEAQRFDAVVMTSASAARLGGARLEDYTGLPLFAVGAATATAARAAGFSDVTFGDGNVESMVPLLPPAARVFHLAGVEHHPLDHGDVTVAVVYQSRACEGVTIPNADVALVHSPRAGMRLAEWVDDPRRLAIVAISPVAAAACGPGWRAVDVAHTPCEQEMLASLARLCETLARNARS